MTDDDDHDTLPTAVDGKGVLYARLRVEGAK